MFSRKELVKASRGDVKVDTVIKNVRLVNVFTAEIYSADIGIKDNRFVSVARYENGQPNYHIEGHEKIDGNGKFAVPGFIDCHVHIESTMMTPENFAQALLERGTTTAIIDPHEIANVLGKQGVEYMIEATRDLPIDILVTIPSSVPAVPGLETSGAAFNAADIGELLDKEGVIGIAELMDYIGVINQSNRMAGIVEEGLKRDVYNEGHLPRVTGRHLDAYLTAGVDSDHESRSSEEIIEKLRQGIYVYIRESSVSQFADIAARAWSELPYSSNLAMCTDDIEASDIYAYGQMNRVIRRCIEEGIPEALAIRFASLNGAKRFNLKDKGAIGPGYIADFALIDSLEDMNVTDVFTNGKHQVKEGKVIEPVKPVVPPLNENTVKLPNLAVDDFKITVPADIDEINITTIEVTRIGTTKKYILNLQPGSSYIEHLPEGYAYVSVTGRHNQNEKPFVGVIKNSGLLDGAYGTTLSHDSHNLIIIGTNAEDMFKAAKYIEETGGGLCLIQNQEVQEAINLPIAGLMSELPVEKLAKVIERFNEKAVKMGIKVGRRSPSMAISSLGLTVIPEIRISNLGLIDVERQQIMPLFNN